MYLVLPGFSAKTICIIKNVAESDAVKRDELKHFSDVQYTIEHYMEFSLNFSTIECKNSIFISYELYNVLLNFSLANQKNPNRRIIVSSPISNRPGRNFPTDVYILCH